MNPAASEPKTAVPAWRRALPLLLSFALLALALHALSAEFSEHHLHDLRLAFHRMTSAALAQTLVFGLGSYACLVGFDAIGLRRSGREVPPAQIALTAFLAHTVGQTVGFAALSGGMMRLRGYGRAGLGLIEIGQVVLVSTLGFVFGAWLLIALTLIVEPDAAAQALPISAGIARAIGIILLAGFAALWLLAGKRGRELRWRTHVLWLPDRKTIAGITALSIVELLLASAAFYVLLPPLQSTSYVGFVGMWLLAMCTGLVSTVPGGLGVFEWTLFKLLPDVDAPSLLAAALVFRITYYLIPLLLATLWAALSNVPWPKAATTTFGIVQAPWRGLRPWLPQIIAIAAFAVGALLVIEGTLPMPHHWRNVAPTLLVVETSHLFASLGGVILLLVGQGLQRRSHAAWVLALALCVLLPLPAWLRSGHVSIALSALLVAAALVLARREFYREGALLDEAWSWPWLRNLGLVLIATTWLLFFAYKNVQYQHQLWWQFAIEDNAPRSMRALVLVALTLFAYGLGRLLHGARRPLPPADTTQLDALAPIVAAGTDTQACLVFTGDKVLLRDEAKQGFVMMQRYGGSLIAMGDPVGPLPVARELIWHFREEADRRGLRPVFYRVGDAHWRDYLDLGLTMVKLGEEALVPLHGFSLEGSARAEFRHAWNKGKRAGLQFRVVPAGEVAPLLGQLHEISAQWLHDKSGTEKGFSLGSFDAAYLCRFPLALVEHEGRAIAFANLWQAPNGGELSIDLMRQASDAPKGTMDYLFVELFLWGRDNGYARFSLGMAPLSGLPQHRLAGRWNRFANLVARHGERFYGFGGLRRFKSKFAPEWRPRYLVAPGGMHLAAALLDVTRLISIEPPASSIAPREN